MSDEVFEKLQRLVFDENKLVTYKTLCRLLDITANKARLCLSDFLTKCKTKNSLSACYLLIGTCTDKDGCQSTRVNVVADDALDAAKAQYSHISSCHVYAIQQGKLEDENTLYTCDYGKTEQVEHYNRFSSIANQNVQIQAGKQLLTRANKVEEKANSLSTVSNKQPVTKKQPEKVAATKNKSPDIFSLLQKKSESQKKSPQKVITTDSKATSVLSSGSNVTSTSPQKRKPTSKVSKTENAAVKNDVKYLFSKQAEKQAENAVRRTETKTTVVECDSTVSSSTDRLSKKRKNKRSENTMKKKSGYDSDDDAKHKKKKHKRIINMDDSDSESDNEQAQDRAQRDLFNSDTPAPKHLLQEEEEEDLIPPTPPVKDGKRKKWKMVTKTFEDEDGFFVTKKTKEYVTDSEESDNEKTLPAKPPVVKEVPKKVIPVNKKQASLTSFFGRK